MTLKENMPLNGHSLMISLVFKTKPDHVTSLLKTLTWLPISLMVKTKLSQRPAFTPSGPLLPMSLSPPLLTLLRSQWTLCCSLSARSKLLCQAIGLCYSFAWIFSHRYSQESPSQFPKFFAQMLTNQKISPHTSLRKRQTMYSFLLFFSVLSL